MLSLLSGPLPSASVSGKNRGEGRVKLSGLGGGGWLGREVCAGAGSRASARAPRQRHPLQTPARNSRNRPKKRTKERHRAGRAGERLGEHKHPGASRRGEAGRCWRAGAEVMPRRCRPRMRLEKQCSSRGELALLQEL